MNSFIELLNHWGARFAGFGLPMLVQSSLLIIVLFVLDLVIRQRVRAVLRYGLWMVVLIKLVLPPSFAAPTGLAYWLPEKDTARTVAPARVVVHYGPMKFDEVPILPALPPPRPKLQFSSWLLLGWLTISCALMAWFARRSLRVATSTRQAIPAANAPEQLLDACRRQMRIARRIRLQVSTTVSSPAVYGLWRPVILVPQRLADKLSALQLRAVLLHELAHIKRGDVLVHYIQTLLQIFYWWHPLLWLANARIRHVREQAVDETVMVEMGGEAEAYPATLLEVAKLALQRPMVALGLIGIVESRSALAQRIKHLLERPVPESARLGFAGLAIVFLAGALLLPMARAERNPNAEATESAQARPPGAPTGDNVSESARDNLTVAITKTGQLYLGTRPVSLEELQAELQRRSSRQPAVKPSVRADIRAPVAEVAKVMDAARDSGTKSNSLVTPPQGTNADSVRASETDGLAKGNAANAEPTDALHNQLTVGEIRDQQPETNRLEAARRLFELGDDLLSEPGSGRGRVPVLGDLPFFGLGREAIKARVNQIILPEVFFDNVPLPEVLQWLSEQAREHDPDGRRLNFLLNPNVTRLAPQAAVDPITGVAVAPLPPQPLDINSVKVRINPPLKNVRLNDVFEAIVRTADKPIRYSIGKYAVIFSPKPAWTQSLETRVFRLNPWEFLQNLRAAFKSESLEDNRKAVQQLVRDFLSTAGVDVEPPNMVFFNDRTGVLMVRATAQELELTQIAIEALNHAPQQITIEAKFMELPTAAARAIGLDLPAPNAPSAPWTRVLTAAQARALLRDAGKFAGADILSAPKITTLSDRQSQVQAVEIRTIVTGIKPEALTPPGVVSANGIEAQPFLTSGLACGPILDLTPSVAPDGFTIRLLAAPEVTEFVGYETSLDGARKKSVWIDGKKQNVALPLASLRTRRMQAAADVYDGQTLLLANPTVTTVSRRPDGQSVTNTAPEDSVSRLVVLITPTLIDPAGNPIHASDNEPFPPNQVPPTKAP